jgi:NAD-reducing hydrogenase large subunit
MSSREIVIDPVTRVEGHGRVTLRLTPNGDLEEARLHIVEFRGFERFVQGRPYWEAPVIVQRLCGICPVSHHLCAAKAIDEVIGVFDETLPQTARVMRRLMHYGQVMQSHALHFFFLAAPDLLLGRHAAPEDRSIVGLVRSDPGLAKRGILIRKFGQEIIRATAGKRIHGISAVPGGIHKNLSRDEISFFTRSGIGPDNSGVPTISEIIQWCREILENYKDYHLKNQLWMDAFLDQPMNSLSLVGQNGEMDLYHGNLRCLSPDGDKILDDVDYHEYVDIYGERVVDWTYLKFPYLKKMGFPEGSVRVGPLARLNVCDSIPTPLAQLELEEYRHFNGRYNHKTLGFHWARLIEILHCAEVIENLLSDPALMSHELTTTGNFSGEGIGFIEAPRGTLIHHYQVAESGEIKRCNLIVSTTHNNLAMNEAVRLVAKDVLPEVNQRTKLGKDRLMNAIEIAIRAYDPCLSCATHALGKMPLKVMIEQDGNLIDEFVR